MYGWMCVVKYCQKEKIEDGLPDGMFCGGIGMKDLLVFGTGKFADVVSYVLETKLGRNIRAYTVHEEHLHETKNYSCSEFAGREEFCSLTYKGKPLVAFEEIQKVYPPEEFEVVLCMIGKQMADRREEVFVKIRQMGY